MNDREKLAAELAQFPFRLDLRKHALAGDGMQVIDADDRLVLMIYADRLGRYDHASPIVDGLNAALRSAPRREAREAAWTIPDVAPKPCFCCSGKLHLSGLSYSCDNQSTETFSTDDIPAAKLFPSPEDRTEGREVREALTILIKELKDQGLIVSRAAFASVEKASLVL